MRRTCKFLLYPTSKQADALAACLEDHRRLYNGALEHRRTLYRDHGKSVRYLNQAAELSAIRAQDPDGQGRWNCSSQQATLRRLDKAYQAFFRRVIRGQKPGFPRFKGAGWFDTIEWPKHGNGCKYLDNAKRVYLLGIGQIKVKAHRAVKGMVKTVSVKREGRRWYVLLSCDDVPAEPLPATGAVVAVDMGLRHFLGTSDDVLVPNPSFLTASSEKLTAAQQALSRCKRGSKRRVKAREVVSAIHRKIRRQRLDHHHKLALALVRDYDVIVHEDLKIANMTRSAKGTVDEPGTNVAQKSGLNRSILDAGWGGSYRTWPVRLKAPTEQ